MEERYNEIIEELKNIQKISMMLELELNEIKDGYIYNATIHSFGLTKEMTFNNYESVRLFSTYYNNDNGYIVVQTTNPDLIFCEIDSLRFEPLKIN